MSRAPHLSPILAKFLATAASPAAQLTRRAGGWAVPGGRGEHQREFLRSQQPYRGSTITNHNQDWLPQLSSGDRDLLSSWPLLPARIRDLVRNNPALVNCKGVLVDNLIAQGIHCYADAMIGEALQDEYNWSSDQGFERWAEEEADVEGRESFFEIQANLCGEGIEVGNGLLMACMDNSPGRSIPLCFQQIEWEQLDRSVDRPAGPQGGKIVNGIEYDLNNRPVFFHVLDAHPYDAYSGWTTKSTPIPVARMIHWFLPFRPSASSGVSWFAALVQPSRDVDQLVENELTAGVIGSLFTVLYKTKGGVPPGAMGFEDGGGANGGYDRHGNKLLRLGKGLVQYRRRRPTNSKRTPQPARRAVRPVAPRRASDGRAAFAAAAHPRLQQHELDQCPWGAPRRSSDVLADSAPFRPRRRAADPQARQPLAHGPRPNRRRADGCVLRRALALGTVRLAAPWPRATESRR
jgi:hypothetical protein